MRTPSISLTTYAWYAPAPAVPDLSVFADSHGNFDSERARSRTGSPKSYSWLPIANAS